VNPQWLDLVGKPSSYKWSVPVKNKCFAEETEEPVDHQKSADFLEDAPLLPHRFLEKRDGLQFLCPTPPVALLFSHFLLTPSFVSREVIGTNTKMLLFFRTPLVTHHW